MKSIAKSAPPQMDIYGSMLVPFNVAVWCRSHKFNVTAVNLASALRLRDSLILNRNKLDQDIEEAEKQVKALCDQAVIKQGDK